MPIREFEAWVAKIVDDEDNYAYRFIYDAYATVSNNNSSYYYQLVPEETRHQLMLKGSKEIHLTFESDADKRAFTDYLFQRFCRDDYQTMADWHAERMQWHAEDIEAWK
jgi:hypothetical protein